MNGKNCCAVILGTVFLLAFIITIIPAIPLIPPPGTHATAVGAAMWIGHPLDVMYQGLIMLAGAISILLLLGSDKSGGTNP